MIVRVARARRARGRRRAAARAGRWTSSSTSGGCAMSAIRSLICALRLGHRRTSARAAGRLGERRCGSARRPGGRRGSRSSSPSIASTSSSSGVERRPGCARVAREHRDAELDRQPRVADVAPAGEQLGRRRGRGRRLVGDERPAAAAAHRVQVAALHQRGQRLAQRRARDAELRAQLALGRQALAGLQQAELDRGPEPLERLLERGLRADRGEDLSAIACGRGPITTARSPARAPSP